MSQTRVRANAARPTTQRGGRGNGKFFQGQVNHSFPMDNKEPKVFGEEHKNKPFTNGNSNRGAFKRNQRQTLKKMWNDNSSNTSYKEQEPVFEEHFNTKLDGNASRGFNRQERVYDHQQIRNDNSMRFNDQQGAVRYVKKGVSRNEKTYDTTGDRCSQSNERCYESPKRTYFSGSSTSSRAQTDSNSSVQDSIPVNASINVPKPPIHARNPIFVHEIMQRFNSILPPSKLISTEKPQEISDEADVESDDQTFVPCNVDEIFRQFQNPTQHSNHKLPDQNKRDNFRNSFETVVSDNKKTSFPSTNKQSQSQGSRDPLLKSGPSGYVDRSPNAVLERKENFKSSGNAVNNNSHNKTIHPSEHSLGAVLFAQIDEFKSKNKSQYEQVNTQTTHSHRKTTTPGLMGSSRTNFPPTSKQSSSQGNRDPEFKSGPSGYVDRSSNFASNAVIEKTEILKSSGDAANNNSRNKNNAPHIQSSEHSLGTVLFESENKFQYKQVNAQTTVSQCKTTPCLMDNNPASNSNTNAIQHEKTLGNLSSEKSNSVIQHPSCNDIPQSSKYSKRNLIFKQFGFEGKPSNQNTDFNQEKQLLKSFTETTLPKQSITSNLNIESGQQQKLESQPDQTATFSKSAVKNTSLPQPLCYNQDKPSTFQGASVQQTLSLIEKKPLPQQCPEQCPEIDKQNSKCFITRSNNTSTQSGSNLTSGKLAGGNVYNIHQPARQSTQAAITRDESIRRLEHEYAEKLIEHKVKEQEKEAKKREERLAKYKYVDQGHRLTEGYLDEAIGGQAYIESEEEIRQCQQEQLRRDALVYQDQERKRNEERVRREEKMKKHKLENYIHVSSGQRLGGSKTEAYIESEEEIRQRQQEQLRRDALVHQEQERKVNESRIRREEEQKKPELDKYKQESSCQRFGDNKYKGSSESWEKKKIDNSSHETSPADVTSLFVEFLKTRGIMKKYSNEDTEELLTQFQMFMANAKKTTPDAQEDIDKKQDQPVAEKNEGNTKVSALDRPEPKPIEKEEQPPQLTLRHSYSKGPVLVIRPTQEALDRTVSQSLAVQDMDKHGHSSLYKPQIEQTPTFFNNKFEWKQPEFSNRFEQHSPSETSFHRVNQWKPQRDMSEIKNVQKSLEEIAKSTGAIPKQKKPMAKDSHPPDCSSTSSNETKNVQKSLEEIAKSTGAIPKQKKSMVKDSHPPDCSSTSSNETACSELTEIDLREEMRAARLRMQKRYDDALRKQQFQDK